MVRPEKPINWDIVEKKMEAGSTAREIAGSFHMNETTFGIKFQKEYGCRFTDYLEQFHCHDGGKSNIKYLQYEKALEGNTQMLMHLGKFWLNQNDEKEDNKKVPTEEMLKMQHEYLKLLEENRKLKEENARKSETGDQLQRIDSTI